MERETETEELEFICKGRLTLDGVTFYIRARSEEEARAKVAAGQWDDFDSIGGSSSDWEMDARSLTENS